MNTTIKCLGFLFITASVISCKKENEKTPLQVPATYQSAGYASNVATEAGLRSQAGSFSSYMKKGENSANTLVLDSLKWYFGNNGSTTLKSITSSYYASQIENSWFPVMVSSSGKTYDPANGATATAGGVYGGRLLDKRGKENLQEIEKGLYAAALYNHFVNLTKSNVNEAAVDKMVAIYGAHPDFPNTNTSAKTPNPDAFIALYAARRDKNDGNGFYSKIKQQFLKLQVAVKGGSDYNEEKNAAIAELKLLMEKTLMATVINYGYAAISKLSTTNPPATTISGGLHDLAESVGFVHGFKAIGQENRKITDAQVDEVLALLQAPSNGDASMYKFVTNGSTELARITQAQQKLKSIYGFSDSEMEDFKQNWISSQGR